MTGKRRSLTITKDNDKKVQHIRSQLLYSNIDIDYTTMVNIFIELGDMIIKSGTYNITDIIDIFNNHMRDIDKDIILDILKDYQNKKYRED